MENNKFNDKYKKDLNLICLAYLSINHGTLVCFTDEQCIKLHKLGINYIAAPYGTKGATYLNNGSDNTEMPKFSDVPVYKTFGET